MSPLQMALEQLRIESMKQQLQDQDTMAPLNQAYRQAMIQYLQTKQSGLMPMMVPGAPGGQGATLDPQMQELLQRNPGLAAMFGNQQ